MLDMIFNYGPVGFIRDQLTGLVSNPAPAPIEEVFNATQGFNVTDAFNVTQLNGTLSGLLDNYADYLPDSASYWMEQAQENPYMAAGLAVPAALLTMSVARRVWRNKGEEIKKEINLDGLLKKINDQINNLDAHLDKFADQIGDDVLAILKNLDINAIIAMMFQNQIFGDKSKLEVAKLLADESAPESLANMIQVMVGYLAENQTASAYEARAAIVQSRGKGQADLKSTVEALVGGYAQAIAVEAPARRREIAKEFGVNLPEPSSKSAADIVQEVAQKHTAPMPAYR